MKITEIERKEDHGPVPFACPLAPRVRKYAATVIGAAQDVISGLGQCVHEAQYRRVLGHIGVGLTDDSVDRLSAAQAENLGGVVKDYHASGHDGCAHVSYSPSFKI